MKQLLLFENVDEKIKSLDFASTSYFARYRDLMLRGIVPISIALKVPGGMENIRKYDKLAPRREMLSMPRNRYTPIFKGMLSDLNPELVWKDLIQLSDYRPFALLCWEGPGKFCHRHLVAEWLNDSLNLNIQEVNWK